MIEGGSTCSVRSKVSGHRVLTGHDRRERERERERQRQTVRQYSLIMHTCAREREREKERKRERESKRNSLVSSKEIVRQGVVLCSSAHVAGYINFKPEVLRAANVCIMGCV